MKANGDTDFVVTVHFHDTDNRHGEDSTVVLVEATNRQLAEDAAFTEYQEEGVSEVVAQTVREFTEDNDTEPDFPRLV